jgi:hypothetical protein
VDIQMFRRPYGVCVIAASEGIDGCPRFAKAYLGRKRWAKPNDRFSSHRLTKSHQAFWIRPFAHATHASVGTTEYTSINSAVADVLIFAQD